MLYIKIEAQPHWMQYMWSDWAANGCQCLCCCFLSDSYQFGVSFGESESRVVLRTGIRSLQHWCIYRSFVSSGWDYAINLWCTTQASCPLSLSDDSLSGLKLDVFKQLGSRCCASSVDSVSLADHLQIKCEEVFHHLWHTAGKWLLSALTGHPYFFILTFN